MKSILKIELGKAFKKNTMTVADYVSQHCDDGDITDFLSSATGAGSVLPPNFTCKKDTDGDGCALRTGRYVSTHEVENVQLTVPMISAMKDEGGKAAAIRSFVHEWTHFLDNCASEWENGKSFSGQHQKLSEALEKEKDISISDEARKLLDDFNTQYDNGQKAYQEERKGLWKKVVDDMFQGKKPDWLNSDGSFDYSSSFFGHYSEVQEYKKRLVKYEKACDKDWRRTKRSFGDGLCTLQGLYDSLYEGRCREQGIVKFGHSTGYFKKEKENRAMELIADYVALKATNPKLAKVFANDKPVIAAALDECIVDMTRKMAGGNKR